MKSRCFVLAAILTMVAMTIILINEVTQAQSPNRGNPSVDIGAFVTPFADKSWVDLTFTLKVDDDTLIKARPIYQKYRDNLENTVNAEREPGANWYGLMKAIRDEFQAELQSVLTEAQIAELNTLEKQRLLKELPIKDR
jgi:hypothetical protein